MLVFLTQADVPVAENSSGSLILTILVVVAVLFYFIGLVVYFDRKKHKNAQEVINDKIFREKKASGSTFLYDFYRALDRIPFIRPWLRNVEERLLPLYPSDEIASSRSFTKPLGVIVSSSIGGMVVSLFLVWALQPSLYTLLAAIVVGYGASVMFSLIVVHREKTKFYDGFDRLLDSVAHFYGANPKVVRAIDMASDTLADDKVMRRHAEEFIDILNSQRISSKLDTYMGKNRERNLKSFILMAAITAENGNIEDEGGSIFMQAIDTIRESIQARSEASKNKMFTFATFGWIAIIPCVAQPYIQNWGIGVMSAMTKFYVGRIGMIMKVLALLLTFISFRVVITLQAEEDFIRESRYMSKLCRNPFVKRFVDTFHDPDSKKTFKVKEIMRRSGDRNVYRSYYVKRVLLAIVMSVLIFFILIAGHAENREYLKYDTMSLEEASQNADSKQADAIIEHVPRYVQGYVESDERPTADEIAELLYMEPGIRTREVAEDAARLVVDRLERYDKEWFDFVDIFIMIVFALVGFFYPTLILAMRERIVNDRMEDEVDQFASMANMLRNAPGVHALMILETMENFAVVFKEPLRKCINYYNINRKKALEEMYLAEKNEGFRKLVRNLMRIDEVGVQIAFQSTAMDIKHHGESRKNERVRKDKKEADFAMIVALVPGCFILFGYLLLPFAASALEMFNSFSETMQSARGG